MQPLRLLRPARTHHHCLSSAQRWSLGQGYLSSSPRLPVRRRLSPIQTNIWIELTARGFLPTTFHAYLAAAISVEQNQAAATLCCSHPSSQPPPRLPPPRPLPLPGPLAHQPPPSGHQPMDLNGTRGYKGPLTMDERRRRSDAGLCAYCAQPGHTLATCAVAVRTTPYRH